MMTFLAALLIFAGCQKKESAAASGSFDADHNWSGAITEITIQGIEAGGGFQEQRDLPVAKELEKKTGVRINWTQVTNEKWALQRSSGDLPDVVRFGASDTTVSSALIKGGHLIALDDLIEKYGPNLKANLGKQLAVSKAVHGNGEKTYVIPTNTGPGEQLYWPHLRWDIYKKIGAPAIGSMDEFLQVVKKMVDAYPVTEEGKKVYGVSSFIDWGNFFPWQCPFFSPMGLEGVYTLGYAAYDTNEMLSVLEDGPRSLYWKVSEYYYKANQLGIFDPDTFTQTAEAHYDKKDANQIMYSEGPWDAGSTPEQLAAGIGFVAVPWKGNNIFTQGGAFNYLHEMGFAVSKNCKSPEAVIRLYDYMASFDGIELVKNGIQGEDWYLEDGVPVLADNIIEARKNSVNILRTRGIDYGGANFLVTLSQWTIDPRYNVYNFFYNIPANTARAANIVANDFAQFYGVASSRELWDQVIARGDIKDQSTFNTVAAKVKPVMPTNIVRIETNLQQLAAAEWGPKLAFAKNDAEFNSLKALALAAFKEAGLDEYTAWIKSSWNDAIAKAKTMGL